ncbi:hypothetical protein COL516b_001723 [Colletotrichum fioriniae]|nr:uncharacterized protein COL516b_001723 [Colletotrichum fioriniae]KAJ0311021.1 hypothetical protein COL516b_001723 [Colletotrichum fioriniae]
MSAAHDHGSQPHSHANEQPGLEVVPREQEKFARPDDPTWSGLQVSYHSYYDSGKEAVSDHNDTDKIHTSDNSSWQTPDKFNSSADVSARLGATIIQYDASYQPQTEVFYTNDDGRVLGVSINDALSPNYEEDSIKNMVLNSRVNSSVAAYWPWVMYQESSGGIVEVRNRLRTEFSPAAEWDKKRLNVSADSDSRLALVPLSTNFSKIAVQGGYGIFYQVNGALVALIPDLGSDELATDYADSWPTAVTNMPGGAPFAAFSVARSSDTLQRVFTYVLYLDNDANISVIYNDASSWKTAQPASLKGVDADTDITCLTMATTHRDSFTQEVVLGAQSFDPRCYFQREGLVREVILSTNNDWVDNGNVPIP